MRISCVGPDYFVNHEIPTNAFEAGIFQPIESMGNFNQSMFNDDFCNMFLGGSRRDSSTFRVSSNNQDLQDKLLGLLVSRHRQIGVNSNIEEVVEEVFRSLIHRGKAVYFLQETMGGEKLFRPVPANSVFRFLGFAFQYLPRRVQRGSDSENEILRREIRFLERKRLLFFDWKKTVWKKVRSQNRILKTLDRYGQGGGAKHLPRPTHENPNPRNYFDFRVWKETQDEALFKATKPTGWSGRISSRSDHSDFFICHRLIRFRKLQIELATHVLDKLSSQLTRAGRQEDRNFELSIEFSDEYQSISKLEDLERRLECEDVGFKEVLDYCNRS